MRCSGPSRTSADLKNIEWGARGREFESRRPDQRNQWVSSHKGLTRFDLCAAGNRIGNRISRVRVCCPCRRATDDGNATTRPQPQVGAPFRVTPTRCPPLWWPFRVPSTRTRWIPRGLLAFVSAARRPRPCGETLPGARLVGDGGHQSLGHCAARPCPITGPTSASSCGHRPGLRRVAVA